MKKVLLGTSAIALAGAFATPADAVEWEVRVGGYMEQFLAYSETDNSVSGDFDGFENKEDSEIHFSPSITLDNGLTFGARIELEGRTGGDQIDETYMSIDGSFGTLRMGEDDVASYNIGAISAPDVTFLNINSGSDTKFWGGTLGSTFTATFSQPVGDPQGISYYSPRLAGFQIGGSYARDGNRATIQGQRDLSDGGPGDAEDIWAVGANYNNAFGDFNVAVAGGYAEADIVGVLGDGDIRMWNAGINLGYGGFTIGGSYKETDVSGNLEGERGCGCGGLEDVVLTVESVDNYVWDAGVSYETGPWGFSFTYLRYDDNSPEDLEIQKFLLGVDYTLAQGVRLGAFGVYGEADSDDVDEESGVNEESWILGTGVRIDF